MLIDLRSFLIIFSLLGIIIAGSLTVYSVTSIDAFYFIRFLLITLISIILVSLFFNYVNLNRVLSAGWLLLVLNLALVLSVEIFGKEINGSKRWLDFGFKFTAFRIYEDILCTICYSVLKIFQF